MINELIFDIYISIFYTVGTINLSIVSIKRRDLIKYLPPYIVHAVGYIFYTLHYIDYTFRLVANICFLLTAIFAFIAFYYEYYLTFLKDNKKVKKTGVGLILINLSIIITIIVVLQVLIILILLISSILMTRIFLFKKTPTYLVLILVPILSLLAIFSAILNELEIYGAWELSYIITLLLACVILILPILAFAEERITKSERKYREAYDLAEFYKNLLAHDIRNVLQNIHSSYELMTSSPEQENNKKSMKYLQIIKEQVMRGATLVSNIYNLSKLSETKLELNSMNLLKNLNKSVNYIQKSFTEKEIIVQLKSEYKDVYVNANDLILGVFENILINAVNHNENQKIEIQIEISKIVENGEKLIKLEIKDNGIGIPDNLKKKLFKRTQKTPMEGKGLGLGLLLVKKIIHSYNGKIWVEDRIKGDYTKGSNFIILIPEIIL